MTTSPIETAICYEDRDNFFSVILKKNSVTLTEEEMLAITKFEIQYAGVYYDSDTYPDAFDRDNVNGTLTVRPYELGLTVGSDKVELIIYDAGDYSHGLLWDQIKLKMKGDAVI